MCRHFLQLERFFLLLILATGTSLPTLRLNSLTKRQNGIGWSHSSPYKALLFAVPTDDANFHQESSMQHQSQQPERRDMEQVNRLQSSFELASTPFTVTGVHCDEDGCCIPHMWYELRNCTSIAFAGPSSHQVLLKWGSHPRQILLLSKPDSETKVAQRQAIQLLLERNVVVIVEKTVHEEEKLFAENVINQIKSNATFTNKKQEPRFEMLNENYTDGRDAIDLVIAFGGDGLLMHCNTLFSASLPPIMCFDFGSLGFLAPFEYDHFEEEIDAIMSNKVFLTLRMRLECTILRNGKKCSTYNVLNEAVVDRGPSPFLAMIDIECDDQYLTTVQGDGIILATPTGSTAYSLAAGGSMVHPSVPAILLTPICAHSLSFRPILLPDSSRLSVSIPLDSRSSSWVSFDGKFRQELQKGDTLEVKMSRFPMPTVNRRNFTGDWFSALRSGFMFNQRGARQRNNLQQNHQEGRL